MIEFLAGAGVLYAYQKRDKWLPKVKETIVDIKNKIFEGKENGKEKNGQQEFDFSGEV